MNDRLLRAGEIGFYGCTGDGGRTVRVAAAPGVERRPLSAIVDCPACGNRHAVGVSWRPATPRDEGREPELEVGEEGGSS